MGMVFVFLAIILSVAKANTWFFVPTFCVSFCWVVSIFYAFVFLFSKTFAKNIIKELNKQIKMEKDEQVKAKLEERKKLYENVIEG